MAVSSAYLIWYMSVISPCCCRKRQQSRWEDCSRRESVLERTAAWRLLARWSEKRVAAGHGFANPWAGELAGYVCMYYSYYFCYYYYYYYYYY